MRYRRIATLGLTIAVAGCARDGNGAVEANAECRILQAPAPLPSALDESSGLAIGRTDSTVLWTHNDSGGDPVLYAIRPGGELVRTVRVAEARNRDWEDLAAGPCPAGECLYIGDIGDNMARRDEIVIYRVPEPPAGVTETEPAERFAATYPGSGRDAEALFVTPEGVLYILTKGRTGAISLFRYPPPLRTDAVVELEHVVDFTEGRAELAEQVTAAATTPDGEFVAVRSYGALMIFRIDQLIAGEPPVSLIDLAPLDEPQGEAVAMDEGGTVFLTSEASGDRRTGTIAVIECEVADAPGLATAASADPG